MFENSSNVGVIDFDSDDGSAYFGGNVGIGTTNPGAQLDLSTDSARKLTTTTWTTGSDIRIKTDVLSITNGLDTINKMRPVQFHYNKEFLAAHSSVKDVAYYSFIAQEYQQVFPDSVSTSTDGLLYLNSSNMIPYAIAGIKELAGITAAIQTKLDELVPQLATSTTQQLITNAWAVAQTSGKVSVNFFGDLNLNGNSIVNVSKIIGMWGKWKIDEDGTITAVKVVADEVTAKNVTIGSQIAPSGITLYDPAGNPHCIKVDTGGALASTAGVCGSTPTTSAPPPPTDTSPTSTTDTASSTPTADTTASLTTETASTTPSATTSTATDTATTADTSTTSQTTSTTTEPAALTPSASNTTDTSAETATTTAP
ncbi:MAG: tail fiber domain-containing protein [Candidatus Sungiibacteriota bacterium]